MDAVWRSTRLGGFLRTLPRSEFIVSTKVGRTLRRPQDPAGFVRAPWVGGLNFEVHFDYSYDGVMRSYEQALQRLALDTVDALIIHDLDAMFHGQALDGHLQALASSGMRALGELKAAGQIKAIGVGINTPEALDQMVAELDIDLALVAMPYTLLDQRGAEAGLATCVRRGIGVIVGAPFASGILAGGSKPGANYGYATAPPAYPQENAGAGGGVRGPRHRPGGSGAAIPACASSGCFHHSRRCGARRGDAEHCLACSSDQRRVLGGPQGARLNRRQCAHAARQRGLIANDRRRPRRP